MPWILVLTLAGLRIPRAPSAPQAPPWMILWERPNDYLISTPYVRTRAERPHRHCMRPAGGQLEQLGIDASALTCSSEKREQAFLRLDG